MKRAVAVLIVLASFLTGCSVSPGRAPDGSVRAVMSRFPQTLSLIGLSETNSEVIARLVTDSLVQYDADLRPLPRLAESWEVSPDGLEIVFHLRGGVRWHDGAPFTSRDVAFTVKKVLDPSTEARTYLGQFRTMLSIETPDDRTVRIRYAVPYADFLDAWTLPIVPEHLVAREPNALTGAFSRHPIGCGPFRFVGASQDREILLEANRDYWDGAPTLRRLVFRVVPDERTAFEALVRGEIDLLAVTPDLWREALRSVEAGRLARFVYSRMTVWYAGWNHLSPFFSDARVRRAMVLALDREAFAARVLSGLARPAAGPYHPSSPWADPDVKPWPYAPLDASRLLDDAGWPRTGGGNRIREGVPFEFTMTIPAGGQEITDRMAAWMQQSYAALGIAMKIEKLEWETFKKRRKEGQFHALMASLQLSPSPDTWDLFHSDARNGGMNYFGISDPEIDELIDLGRRTFDETTRRALYSRLQRSLHQREDLSFLFHFASPVLHDPRLVGIRPSPLGLWLAAPGPRAWSLGGGSSSL